GPAVGYYTQCLGFSLVSRDRTTAMLRRDDVQIGLAGKRRDPGQAGCWVFRRDLFAPRGRDDRRGLRPGGIRQTRGDREALPRLFREGALRGLLLLHPSAGPGGGRLRWATPPAR